MRNQQFMLTLFFATVLSGFTITANASAVPVINYSGSVLVSDEVNGRAVRDFEKKFPAVTGEKWTKTNGGYLVKFTQNNTLHYCSYDDKGRFVMMTRYLDEETMPHDVKLLVQKQFEGYTIGVVTETTSEETICYQVTIKNYHCIKTLRISDAVAEVINNWNLQDVVE